MRFRNVVTKNYKKAPDNKAIAVAHSPVTEQFRPDARGQILDENKSMLVTFLVRVFRERDYSLVNFLQAQILQRFHPVK